MYSSALIGGTRVSSKPFSIGLAGPHDERRRLPLTPQVQRMVDAIPFWPKAIYPGDLAQQLGCRINTIYGYLRFTTPGRYLQDHLPVGEISARILAMALLMGSPAGQRSIQTSASGRVWSAAASWDCKHSACYRVRRKHPSRKY